MNQWVDQIYQWTLRHPAVTVVLFLAAAVIPLAIYFWSVVRTFVSFCWSRTNRQAEHGAVLPSSRLKFVPILSESRCLIGTYDKWLLTQIDTLWHITNVSESPVRLLAARLLKPRVRHPSVRCEVFPGRSVGDPFDDDYGVGPEIPSRKTRKVSIHFHVNIHLQRPGKPLRVKFAVTDQLSEEHRMPTIMIQTIDMTPEK
jgi:hypothetical protein